MHNGNSFPYRTKLCFLCITIRGRGVILQCATETIFYQFIFQEEDIMLTHSAYLVGNTHRVCGEKIEFDSNKICLYKEARRSFNCD